MSDKVQELIKLIENNDRRGLAKAITYIENKEDDVRELLNYTYRHMKDDALIIGVTGPGGAGKSTMVDKIIREYRKDNKKVGVIAVDPSSPYTGGAFLGDRVRMSTHSTDKDVYIRSFGSRGAMGGISMGTKQCLYLYKNYDFDVIIIESLGIGQDETEITNFVDVTIVATVPGFGDVIQISKAGMQEIADIFVINKADKPDAEEYYQQMANSVAMIPEEIRPIVVKTVAETGDGISELVEIVEEVGNKHLKHRLEKSKVRIKTEIESEVISLVKSKINKEVETQSKEVYMGDKTPFDISDKIFEVIKFGNNFSE